MTGFYIYLSEYLAFTRYPAFPDSNRGVHVPWVETHGYAWSGSPSRWHNELKTVRCAYIQLEYAFMA